MCVVEDEVFRKVASARVSLVDGDFDSRTNALFGFFVIVSAHPSKGSEMQGTIRSILRCMRWPIHERINGSQQVKSDVARTQTVPLNREGESEQHALLRFRPR